MPDRLDVFEAERGRLFGVAYRMLGTRSDAEDIVQEAYLRWMDVTDDIREPAAYLTTVTSRLAMDRLRSAQHKRETYVGPWLPEPLVGHGDDPADDVVMAESLTMAFLTLLERLNPTERAVLILHDVFKVPFDEVAATVDRSVDNCRQIARRARQHVNEERRRFEPRDDASALVGAFVGAVVEGDLAGLEQILAEDCVHMSDGGGAVYAARRPVVGRDRVARFFINLAKRVDPSKIEAEFVQVNGEPGIVLGLAGRPFSVIAFRIVDGLVQSTHSVLNPEKLGSITND